MPIMLNNIAGILNTDDPVEALPKGHHIWANNGVFRGNPGNMQFRSAKGTRAISNSLPAGTNECCGAFYDNKRQRIYYFNFNSNGNHGIYVYYIRTGAVAQVAVVGVNTDGDIFGFDLDNPIYAVQMLYGDSTQGDILYFNNSQKQPCAINVTRAIAGSYGTIKRSFIDVIKAPAIMPPAATYENDATVTVNNLRKKLFKIKVRFIYGNKEKPVTSAQSVLPLPVNALDSSVDKDPTKNARIAIVVPTGTEEVKKIEVLIAVSGTEQDGISLPNQLSPYFLVETLDKSALSISSNDLYTIRFYNDKAYNFIDPKEDIQLQDLVPLEANDVAMLNGDTPIYGGILEGYNPATLTATSTSTSVSQRTTQPPFIFITNQSGDSGFGTGNIHAILLGTITVGQVFNIYTTNHTITFTATVATTANVITGLAAAAVVAGFTTVSSDTENLVITKTNEILQRSTFDAGVLAVTNSFVHDWNSRLSYAVIYFDGEGRTCGAITTSGVSVQTVNYTESTGTPNIPKLTVSITSRPPLEAKYFHLLRTKNTTKSKFLYWVSDRTYKDDKFAYIGIENLNSFIKENEGAKHLAYSFAPNDRIRFLKVLSGSVNTIYTDNDFEIVGQVFSPEINGVVQAGQFVKIALPTTSGTFDFNDVDFYNYFIQLYTPAKSVSGGLDLYYEFGERYSVGNPGTGTRYHQGMTQNQTSNLSQSANFEFTQGDAYYRSRIINTGGDLNYSINAGSIYAGRHTLDVSFVDRTFTNADITTGNSPLQDLSGWTYASDTRALVKVGGGAPTYTFRAKGKIIVNASDDDTFHYRFWDKNGVVTHANSVGGIAVGLNTFEIDCQFQLGANNHISLVGWSDSEPGGYNSSKWYGATELKISVVKEYTVGVIDPNFSDYFESAVNSNGREWINDPNASQTYFPTLLRWGLNYEVDTEINRSNRFYEPNFDQVSVAEGDIVRMVVDGQILKIFQQRNTGQKGIYEKFIRDTGGTNIIATTDEIITKNNITYYQQRVGMGSHPTSLVVGRNKMYFADPVNGYQVRLDNQGVEIISLLYKGQEFIQPLIASYDNDILRANGSRAKIMGAYDFFEEEYVTHLQAGEFDSVDYPFYTFSFNEDRNAYSSFFDYEPDWMIGAEDKIYSWKNGALYVHDAEGAGQYSIYYGTEYNPSIKLVFNDREGLRKTLEAVSYQANQYWESPTNGDIKTNELNEFTGFEMVSNLKSVDYSLRGVNRDAAFNRDANSGADAAVAVLEGDYLTGQLVIVNFVYQGNNFGWIFEPYVNYTLNNRNY